MASGGLVEIATTFLMISLVTLPAHKRSENIENERTVIMGAYV